MKKESRNVSRVTERREITDHLVVLRFVNPTIARETRAGQFVNVIPKTGFIDPLLRRPFSVYQRGEDWAEIIVQDHGRGTGILSRTQPGDTLDVLGPLGNPWKFDAPDYKTAILVIGGVGVASMPLLLSELSSREKKTFPYYGARSSALFADEYLNNVCYATDDGSRGFKGNVIELLRNDLSNNIHVSPKLFVCGPTPMMRAAMALAEEFGINCEVSLETEMACGIGICQGCPVVTTEHEHNATGKKFHLVCTQGPSFEKEQVRI